MDPSPAGVANESDGDPSPTSQRLFDLARRRLPLVHFVADAVLWAMAIPAAVLLRYDFAWSRVARDDVAIAMASAVVLQGFFGLAYGLYRRRWRYGSFDEVRIVALTAASVGLVMTMAWWGDSIAERAVPRSVPLLAASVSLLGQIATRSMWRLYSEHRLRPNGDDLERLVLVGAGQGAEQVLRTLRVSSDAPYVPVAMIDDDPAKRNLRLSGVRVEGRVEDLPAVAERHRADAVLIAAPSADGAFYRRVAALADSASLSVLVLPPVERLLGAVQVGDIRPITEADLLGRDPADIDPEAVASYVTGRRVLVTGAGGSIGSELCRQLVGFDPGALLMLDRDESGLHGTQLSIDGRGLLDTPNLVLADIRDAARVEEIFEQYRPDVVFHAAALKHLPLLELHPAEGWKTNVVGTWNLLDAAHRHGVTRFVNVSTDKAANPTSVLGWTKRITERLTAHANSLGGMECVSVRFGNVLGSNGSVLKAFEAQSRAGGPITVTHPDITRYFMTIEEASRLTVYAGAIADPGEVLILDMGDPVRILDVAERFAHQHNPPLKIEITGLRPHEKLHEDLIASTELGERRIHKLITHVTAPPLAPTPDLLTRPAPSFDELQSIALSSESPSAAPAPEPVAEHSDPASFLPTTAAAD